MLQRCWARRERRSRASATVLRRLRERRGLTQQELAERAGLTPHAVSALERGTRTRPYPHTVRSLADALERVRGRACGAGRRRPPSGRRDARLPGRSPGRTSTGAALLADGPGRPADPLFGRDDGRRRGRRAGTRRSPAGHADRARRGREDPARRGGRPTCSRREFPDGVVQVSLAPLADAGDVVSRGRTRSRPGRRGRPGARFDAVAAHLRQLATAAGAGQLRASAQRRRRRRPPGGRCAPGSRCWSPAGRRCACAPSRSTPSRRSPCRRSTSPPPDELAAAPAGALVLDRARAVAATARPRPPDEVGALAELCHRLAGLPLAIELATAHLRLLAPRRCSSGSTDAMAASGARDLPERQRTMRATLDWSYGLLSPSSSGCSPCSGSSAAARPSRRSRRSPRRAATSSRPRRCSACSSELVEQSLVRRPCRRRRRAPLRPAGAGRAVRPQPARRRAGRRGSRRAHAAGLPRPRRAAAVGYEQADQVAWLARVEADEANILVAVERSLDLGDADTAGRITWAMWLYWWLRGQFAVGRRLAEQCLTRRPVARRATRRVQLTAATMSYAGGDHEAAAAHWADGRSGSASSGDPEIVVQGPRRHRSGRARRGRPAAGDGALPGVAGRTASRPARPASG